MRHSRASGTAIHASGALLWPRTHGWRIMSEEVGSASFPTAGPWFFEAGFYDPSSCSGNVPHFGPPGEDPGLSSRVPRSSEAETWSCEVQLPRRGEWHTEDCWRTCDGDEQRHHVSSSAGTMPGTLPLTAPAALRDQDTTDVTYAPVVDFDWRRVCSSDCAICHTEQLDAVQESKTLTRTSRMHGSVGLVRWVTPAVSANPVRISGGPEAATAAPFASVATSATSRLSADTERSAKVSKPD
eukprot:TRINITY_DN37015_c0_g1_i1.p1 TRINITY_DN37015_c0_g1~~TRINITY_DN37015_c0_g1_i1.p1  ORF type:complete len:241 (+),score=17.02 TRINITY_DN37015_c0_g1_i1:187-909(+)